MGVSEKDAAYIRRLLPEIKDLQDRLLAGQVVQIWDEMWKESNWAQIEDCPKSLDAAAYKLIPHVRSVTQGCMAMARSVTTNYAIPVQHDVLLAAALLHDASKLVEEEPEGAACKKTKLGMLIQHGAYTAHKALNLRLPLEIVHLILTHTHASGMLPKTIEGIILHYVDYGDSDVLLLAQGKKLLLRR
jgi:hypothetical protein